MDCSPPSSFVHGVFQARILEWVAISYSRGVFPTRGSNPHLLHWQVCCSTTWEVLTTLDLTPWRPTRPSRTNTPKDVLFIIGDWNAKVGSQEKHGVTGKFGLGVQNEAGQRLIEFYQENPLQTTQEKTLHMDITRWSIPKSDWLYSLQPKMEKLYTVSKNKTWNLLWHRSWTPYCQTQT